jgi:hypothetical protein
MVVRGGNARRVAVWGALWASVAFGSTPLEYLPLAHVAPRGPGLVFRTVDPRFRPPADVESIPVWERVLRRRGAVAVSTRGFERGVTLAEAWRVEGRVHLVRFGPVQLSASGLEGIQEDPAAFRVLAGAVVPERASVPSVTLSWRGLPCTWALGALWVAPVGHTDAGFWGVTALTLPL